MNKVFVGYMIMRVRMKIGFEITLKKQTFQEIWLNAILKAYLERESAGLISNPYPKPKYKLIDELCQINLINCFYQLKEC